MALARVEQKVFQIKKETVRGTAEANATSARSIPVLPGSEINLDPGLLENAKIFGDANERDAVGGIRAWSGTLELEPGADKLGELMLSLFGGVVTDQPDAGGAPTVFRHRFVSDADAQHPMYTLFVDRQIHQKKYAGMSVPQMTFTFPVDGRIAATADILALSEAAGAVLTPDFSSDLEDLLFSDVQIDIVGVKSTQVRQASVQVNHNSIQKHVLCNVRDAVDIVAGMQQVTGTFTLYFEDQTERDKFVASTVSDIFISAQGQTLEGAEVATLFLDMPRIKYSAGAWSEQDGIIVQDFSFVANKDAALGSAIQATLINLVTAY